MMCSGNGGIPAKTFHDLIKMEQDYQKEIASLRKKLQAYENVKVFVGDKEMSLIEAQKLFHKKLADQLDINKDIKKKLQVYEDAETADECDGTHDDVIIRDLRIRLKYFEDAHKELCSKGCDYQNEIVGLYKRVQELEEENKALLSVVKIYNGDTDKVSSVNRK